MSETLQTHDALLYLVQHTGDMLDRQLDQRLQEQLGIGMSQYKVLVLLEQQPEQGQRILADSLGQTEAAVSRQITLLGRKGYIQGRINDVNRRQHLVAITPKGAKLLAAARQTISRDMASLSAALSEKQQHQLQDLLVTMHAWTCQKGRAAACSHPFHL
jgi:DNA-binding MarR family transcriptional regulator